MLSNHIEIKESNSKLSFTTTGGSNWEVWDRYDTGSSHRKSIS